MQKLVIVLGLAALAVSPVSAQITYGESVPVQLEAIEDLDACTLGMVANVGPDSSAMVRTGPDSEYDTIDYLADGDLVWVCQSDGEHYGIVYSSDPDLDCEVSSPVEATVNYSGPCDTGWVMSDWVEIIAG
ncbi:hypothetical protein [Parerythrobacter lacustris]|uniref:Integron n=1 Tax=Parerythrobacter lacustris TaxID=2969984 RepID=A0ABT1XSB8_9SPHN|nr:hypothetical protein [Parerythrobacter lacustris]MCR2834549.1 hypothetical protein [Parerythrobacter lacustris]